MSAAIPNYRTAGIPDSIYDAWRPKDTPGGAAPARRRDRSYNDW